MEKFVSGIDEAGRGSVFGPLMIVGLTLYESDVRILKRKGLKDSKLFTGLSGRKKLNELAIEIQHLAKDKIIKEIPSKEIDRTLAKRPLDNLNLLEIRNFYQILKDLKSNKTYIDNLSSPKYTVDQIRKLIHTNKDSLEMVINSRNKDYYSVSLTKANKNKMKVVIATKADKKYSIVAAASCVAKHLRDNRLREIEKIFKLSPLSLGQGYPNSKDKHVMKFLEDYQEQITNRNFPFIRYNWEWGILQELLKQPEKTLEEYF